MNTLKDMLALYKKRLSGTKPDKPFTDANLRLLTARTLADTMFPKLEPQYRARGVYFKFAGNILQGTCHLYHDATGVLWAEEQDNGEREVRFYGFGCEHDFRRRGELRICRKCKLSLED